MPAYKFMNDEGSIVEVTEDNGNVFFTHSSAIPSGATISEFIPEVNAAQIRLQLNVLGIRQAVEDHIASSNQNVRDKWQFSPRFSSTDTDVIGVANALNLSTDQLNQLFKDASRL